MKGQEENSNGKNKGPKTRDVYTSAFNTKNNKNVKSKPSSGPDTPEHTEAVAGSKVQGYDTQQRSNSGGGDGPSSKTEKQGHAGLRHALNKYMRMEVGRHNSTCWSKIQSPSDTENHAAKHSKQQNSNIKRSNCN